MDNNNQKNVQTATLTLSPHGESWRGAEGLESFGFIAYLGKNEVPFKDFDALLMRNYHTWLKNQELGRNTISLYIRNLKRVYKLAVNDGLAADSNPFEGMETAVVEIDVFCFYLFHFMFVFSIDRPSAIPGIQMQGHFIFSLFSKCRRRTPARRFMTSTITMSTRAVPYAIGCWASMSVPLVEITYRW